MSPVTLTPGRITLVLLEEVYRGAGVTLDRACLPAVEASAEVIAKAAAGNAPVYGVNTGFGKLAHVRVPPSDTAELQRNLIRSHQAGVGAPLPEAVVRLVTALKLASLGRGASGVRPGILALLEAMLERGVVPVIPGQGSVGSSGDLAPLAHLAAVLIGEGRATFRGEELPGGEALRLAELEPVTLRAKEGLALINGTQVSTALALAGLFEGWRAATASVTTGALATDAAMGSAAPFRPEIHVLRGQPGQVEAAAALRALIEGSEIRESHRDGDQRVQDPYCLRCQPQVLGACLDVMRQAGVTLEREANAATDNPLILPDGSIVSGGNFHGEPVGFAADQVAMALAEAGAIAQRRVALLVDPALSFGLPPFLTPRPGLHSGLMIAEVTAAALMSENKALANPRTTDSTPTSANQEDHVAMSCHAARRLGEMAANLARIVGVEAIAAAQGVELRAPLRTSEKLQGAVAAVREAVPALTDDRPVGGDIEASAGLVQGGALVPERFGAPALTLGGAA